MLSTHLEQQVLRQDGSQGRRLCEIQQAEWCRSTFPNDPANQALDSMNGGLVLKTLHGAELQRAEHLLYRGGRKRLFVG